MVATKVRVNRVRACFKETENTAIILIEGGAGAYPRIPDLEAVREELHTDVMAHDVVKRCVVECDRDMAAAARAECRPRMPAPTHSLRYVYEYMINGSRMYRDI